MIGSPERVKIQRSLVQNLSKIQQRLKIIGRFLTFWGVKIPPDGHNKFWGSNNIKNEFTAPLKYSVCKFSAKSNNFKKTLCQGGFLTFLGSEMPPGGANQNFLGIYTMIFSKKTIRLVSIPKIRKNYSSVWKIQAQKSNLQPKGFLGTKPH